jgi:hypothetical protein
MKHDSFGMITLLMDARGLIQVMDFKEIQRSDFEI